jgi:hypothetical protein
MKQKAWDILAARPDYDGAKRMLKGQKITSFFMDIMGEFNVTIDGHARNIAYGERVGLTDDRTNIGVREYRALQAAYEEAARRVALMPYQLQAITWRVWRDRHGNVGANFVSALLEILSAHCFTFWGSVGGFLRHCSGAGLSGRSDRRRDDGASRSPTPANFFWRNTSHPANVVP